MGKALRDGYRQKVFLMTKIDGRTREAATKQLEDSPRRLQTDHIDLLQFHEIIRPGDPEKVFAPGAGMEAIVEARKAGKVRYIGYRAQESRHPFEDAGDRRRAQLSLRCGADAAE